MKPIRSLLVAAVLGASPLSAQVANAFSPVFDVGLQIDGGALTVIYGVACGNSLCQTTQVGPVARGQARVVTAYGAPNQPFVLALSLGQPTCNFTVIGGVLFGNGLMLPQPVTLAFGIMSPQVTSQPCQQGRGTFTLLLPQQAPVGTQFLLEVIAMSASYPAPSFSGALQCTVQ